MNLLRDSRWRLWRRALRRGCSGLVQNAVVDGEERQFQPVGDTDFVIHVAQIILDDLLGRSQLRRDFFVLVALNDQRNDFVIL